MSSTTTSDARILRQPDAEYYQDVSRHSASALSTYYSSRWLYYLNFVANEPQPRKETPAMKIGSAIHALLLGGCEICTYPPEAYKTNGHLNFHGAKQCREENPGAIWLTHHEHKIVRHAVRAVQRHEHVSQWISAAQHKEVVGHWEYMDLPMRAKFDCIRESADGECVFVFDLKTGDDPSPFKFRRKLKSLRGWVQYAHYTLGAEAIFGKPCIFKWVCVDTGGANQIAIYDLDTESSEFVLQRYNELLESLRSRYEHGDWRDVWEWDINEISFDESDIPPIDVIQGAEDDDAE